MYMSLVPLISYDLGNLAYRINIRDVTPGTLTATDTCIGYHVTRFEASRNVIFHTRYVSTCVWELVVGGVGEQRKQKQSAVAHVILMCDMYKSSLRHIHDPVPSSLKMKGILSFLINRTRAIYRSTR
jgi:hypothetical protein